MSICTEVYIRIWMHEVCSESLKTEADFIKGEMNND